MDIKDYILWGGGALIGLVILHGLWMAWRPRRVPVEASGEVGAAELHQPDLEFEDAAPALGVSAGDETPGAMGRARVEPAVGVDWSSEPTPAHAPADSPDEDGDMPVQPKRGRRVEIPGKRTVPTVPRTSRKFDIVQAQKTEAQEASANGLDDVVVIWILAKSGASLNGQDLLEALTTHQLRYGGDVFRKLDPNTHAERYKVVNGVEPGTFDLSDLDALSTPRIVMLLRFSPRNDPAEAFEDMLEVAQDVAASLDAELKDENMSDMSSQTIEHCRQRIRDYKRMSIRK